MRPRRSEATPSARCTWPAAPSTSRSRPDDTELLQTIIRQWERTIERRTYLTGGMGSRHTDESFGEDYELPPDRAYSETCAGVASVQLAWRLLLATGDVRYADLIERTLFNVVATSPALDGSGFFYANPLHQRVPGEAPDPDAENMRAASSLRAPWFHVSCCPTNVARTFASLSGYIATADDGGVQIHQLMPCHDRGRRGSRYESSPATRGATRSSSASRRPLVPWRLSLRVPSWAHEAVLVDRGHRRPVKAGYAVVDATWKPGDEVRLELPMRPRWTRPDPHVDAVRGCVAVERGPIVYCLESTDQGADVSLAEVPPTRQRSRRPRRRRRARRRDPRARVRPLVRRRPDDLTFIPYHAWGNRGLSTMRVWVPEAAERLGLHVEQLPDVTVEVLEAAAVHRAPRSSTASTACRRPRLPSRSSRRSPPCCRPTGR